MAELYLDFFKFKKSPFHITPDPDFLFMSPTHKEASAAIVCGTESRKGFVAVTGEVGVGKTTVLRAYVKGADPEKIRVVYLFNADLSFDSLLKQICSELNVQAAGQDTAGLLDTLFHYLLDEYNSGRNVVLIIDEAQNMPAETLDRLRLLSDFETNQDKLLQIILAGQPEFEAKLDLPELRQLKQRIAIRARIVPLTPEESIAYIYHRLTKASLFLNPVFTGKALKLIVKKGYGIPRTINILCDNALITAFGYQRIPVDHLIVKEVILDFWGESRLGFNWKIVFVPAVLVGLVAAVYVLPSLMLRLRVAPLGKQSPRAELAGPAPSAVDARIAPGVDKKPPVVVRLESNGGAKGRSKTTSVPNGKKLSTASVSGSKAGSAVVGHRPKVLGSLSGKSSPTVLAASPSGPLQKGPGRLPSALGPQAQANSSNTRQTRLEGKTLPYHLVVKKGDSVYNLLLGACGRADMDMIKSFKILNPQVKDINRIVVGQSVILPQVEPGKP